MSVVNELYPQDTFHATNPFLSAKEVQINQKAVKTRTTPRELMDPNAGEVGAGVIHVIEGVGVEQFTKALTDGVCAAFDLSNAGSNVFQTVLLEYLRAKMTDSRCDSVALLLSQEEPNDKKGETNKARFQDGLKELLSKGLLAQKAPNQYWLNRAVFFDGIGVILIREYRLNSNSLTGN
ncbi:hypothetical protein GR247_38515 [Rhizobium leguminosarum]|nr:hypothetical protein [Rhizobium leguminosarum]